MPCQRAKVHRHTRATVKSIPVPDQRFDHVHIDLVILPQVGTLRYCLTIIDRFSRWPVAIPLSNMEAPTVAEAFFKHWISSFGTPLTITTDQGTQFESKLFSALAAKMGAHKIHTTPYHPAANGMVERWHRTLKAALMCSPETPGPQLLPSVLLGLRTALKEDIGASPAELLYGLPIRLPGDIVIVSDDRPTDAPAFLKQLRSHFDAIRPAPASNHSKLRPFVSKSLQTCTHVFVKIGQVRKALEPPYSGPYKVLRRINDNKDFVIDFNGTEQTKSIDNLIPAFIAAEDQPAAQPPPADPAAQPPPAGPAAQPPPASPPIQPADQPRPAKRVTFCPSTRDPPRPASTRYNLRHRSSRPPSSVRH